MVAFVVSAAPSLAFAQTPPYAPPAALTISENVQPLPQTVGLPPNYPATNAVAQGSPTPTFTTASSSTSTAYPTPDEIIPPTDDPIPSNSRRALYSVQGVHRNPALLDPLRAPQATQDIRLTSAHVEFPVSDESPPEIVTAPEEFSAAGMAYPPASCPTCDHCNSSPCGHRLASCTSGMCKSCGSAATGPLFGAHGTGPFSDFLYLQPTGADVDFAAVQTGAAPRGAFGIADPDYDTGIRFGLNAALTDAISVAGTYTIYESNSRAAAVPVAPDNLVSTVLHPTSPTAAINWTSISTAYDIDFQTADLDLRTMISNGELHAVNFTIGARYGQLDQHFTAMHTELAANATTVFSDVNFYGVGVKLGLGGERRLADSLFSVYGQGLMSLLTGEFQASYEQRNTANATTPAFLNFDDDRVVPMLECELGVAVTTPNGIRLTAGYQMSAWFNVVTTADFIDAVQANRFDDVDDTITFDGFVTRAEVRR